MGQADYLKLGDWNAICDRCGKKHKASKLRLEWTGFRVCRKCWEPRHPSDFQRVPPDNQNVPWTRPDNPCDSPLYGVSNIAGAATAGGAVVGWYTTAPTI